MNLTIDVTVIRSNPPVLPNQISWYYWNEASSNNESETIETINDRVNVSEDGRSLYFYELSSEDEGYYQVLISHPAGKVNKTTYLRVEGPPEEEGIGNYYAKKCFQFVFIRR